MFANVVKKQSNVGIRRRYNLQKALQSIKCTQKPKIEKKIYRNRPIERASECYSPYRIYNSLLRMRAIHELKRRNSPNWLCFTARRSEESLTQRLQHVMVSRQSSHSMTSCHPADRCSICGLNFWWFHVTPQASSTIRHTIEIFRVMLSNLMFS